MSKKMTATEFKRILDNAGIDFKLWGYEGVLNMLSIKEDYDADDFERRGVKILADISRNRANAIYQDLKARGYYADHEVYDIKEV